MFILAEGTSQSFFFKIAYFCIIYKSIIAPHFEYCAKLVVNMDETQISVLKKT